MCPALSQYRAEIQIECHDDAMLGHCKLDDLSVFKPLTAALAQMKRIVSVGSQIMCDCCGDVHVQHEVHVETNGRVIVSSSVRIDA